MMTSTAMAMLRFVFTTVFLVYFLVGNHASAFVANPFLLVGKQERLMSPLHMVLEKPPEKKLAKIEVLKIESDHLTHPLREVRYDYDVSSCMSLFFFCVYVCVCVY